VVRVDFHCQRSGFTVIELLVVVAIIAILISLLLPSLSRARQQAHAVVCLGRCRELGHGVVYYLNDWDCYPAHKLAQVDRPARRWYHVLADYLSGEAEAVEQSEVLRCPTRRDWEIGRNNSYGYNYKYLGSARFNSDADNPYGPFESFPIRRVRDAARTIAFADCDGTGWTLPWGTDKNPDRYGNHGYTLDPTYIPLRSLNTTNDEGVRESYAWHNFRTYMSDRHLGRGSTIFADGHGESVAPEVAYRDNGLWNGLGFDPADTVESPYYEQDRHVEYKVDPASGQLWRYGGNEE
jgi:prepilin-type N-terminal cleavage/methylation domain-containing protein